MIHSFFGVMQYWKSLFSTILQFHSFLYSESFSTYKIGVKLYKCTQSWCSVSAFSAVVTLDKYGWTSSWNLRGSICWRNWLRLNSHHLKLLLQNTERARVTCVQFKQQLFLFDLTLLLYVFVQLGNESNINVITFNIL